MFESRRPIHAWAVLALCAATLALATAAVTPGSPQRSFERSLPTHNTLAGPGFFNRGTKRVGTTAPRTQDEQQATPTPPGIRPRPGSAEGAAREATGSTETSPLVASARPFDDKEANSSRAESGAPAESAAARNPRFIGKFKDWYEGKKKEEKEEDRDIVVITTGTGSHGYHHPTSHQHHQPIVQPIIIGTGSHGYGHGHGHGHAHPVFVTKTQYVTVPHAVAVTFTETVTQARPSVLVHSHVTPSYVTAYVTNSHVHAYMTPSHMHIQEPHTVLPVIIGTEPQDSGFGWHKPGHGAHSHDHVVYVMKPKPPAHEVTGGAHVIIQEQESPRLMDKGLQKIKETFGGIYKFGEGIGSSMASLFEREKPSEAEVIVLEQPHMVTVAPAEAVVTRTVYVHGTH